jgi:membrane protease YdiL (CAAX protease family)
MIDNVLPPLEPTLMPTQIEPPKKKIWGPWATIGFGAIVMFAISVVQGIVALIFIISEFVSGTEMDIEDLSAQVNQMLSNGDLFSTATFGTFVVGMILILIFIKVRGVSIKEYLAIHTISKKAVLAVIAVTIGFLALSFGLDYLKPTPSESNIMLEAYRNIMWAPMLWIATVICAPVFEEALFRGFIFIGLQKSKVGAAGAIILTALPWALLHIQYQIFQILMIFVLGIILGVVRHKTGSLWSSLIIHALNNLIAMVQIHLIVSGVIS